MSFKSVNSFGTFPTDSTQGQDERHMYSKVSEEDIDDSASDGLLNEHAQDGVKQAEAVTLAWTQNSLAAAYILMWILYFINGMQSSMNTNLSPYITSGFEAHSLVPLIGVISSVMGAATYMPLAKVLNLWDRSFGFAMMAILATLGLFFCAICNSVGTYCAAQVLYSIGFSGMIFSIDVITADTSSLRNRGLAYAFTSSPYIITAYAGPAACEKLHAANWRWAYGAFAVILPVFAMLMVAILRNSRYQAKIKGLLPAKQTSGRTPMQGFKHHVIEFDVLGTFFLASGLVLLLLPFHIASRADHSWRDGGAITILVLGMLCVAGFALSEKYIAPVPFLPSEILMSRTVLGACLVAMCYQIAYYCWSYYFTSFLQVVSGTSLATSGWISSTFDVVSGVCLLAVGFAITKTCRFRWILYWSVPLYLLGEGLMIYFRRPGVAVGYIVMCQILIALAGGAMIIVQQVAVLAASDHNNAASSLAFLSVFGNIGGAIGGSISGAIWQQTLPAALQRYLPESTLPDWKIIYEDLKTQLSYPKGTETRIAIEKAYSVAQSRMLIAGTAVMALSLIWMFVMRDLKLTKQQTKGVLF